MEMAYSGFMRPETVAHCLREGSAGERESLFFQNPGHGSWLSHWPGTGESTHCFSTVKQG